MGAGLVLAVARHVGGESGVVGVVSQRWWAFAVGVAVTGAAACGEEFMVALLDEVLGGGGVGVVLWVWVARGFVLQAVVEGALVGDFAFGVFVFGFVLVDDGLRAVAAGFPDRRHVARCGCLVVVVAVRVAHLWWCD